LNHNYTINLVNDLADPVAYLSSPLSDSWIPDSPRMFNVFANDPTSGIIRVEFLWHSGDWQYSSWTTIFTDTDGTDGWTTTFEPALYPEQAGMAFYAKVFDWAGNFTGTASWNVGIDKTPPITALQPLLKTLSSTAVNLEWSGSDYLSGIAYYNLQNQKNSGAWNDVLPDPIGSITHTWFIGDGGNSYGFRIRGVDIAGNVETFPSAAEASTNIPTATILCSSPDQWEQSNDNNFKNASIIYVDTNPQMHNFCNKASPNYLYDEDWLKFNAETSHNYLIDINPLSQDTAVILELYAADGVTLLSSFVPEYFGEPSQLLWIAKTNGIFYLRLRHMDGRVIGNNVAYNVRLLQASAVYLPLLIVK
jgi:hypothetical protein